MYKLLLCLRYLRTRYIALASIISVMLGVATMIVVNSVMAGFTHEMHKRLHGILSDIVCESHGLDGFDRAAEYAAKIREVLGDDLEAMSSTVTVPAMLNFEFRGQWITRQVNLIGVDVETYAAVSECSQYLLHPENRRHLQFELREGGYDSRFPYDPGWGHRRAKEQYARILREEIERCRQREAQLASFRSAQGGRRDPSGTEYPIRLASAEEEVAGANVPRPDEPMADTSSVAAGAAAGNELPDNDPEGNAATIPIAPPAEFPDDGPPDPFAPGEADLPAVEGDAPDPFRAARIDQPVDLFDPMKEQFTGIILGIAVCSVRKANEEGEAEDFFLCVPGDDVRLTFPTCGTPPQAVSDTFTIVDLYESKMSEYDASFAFVPLEKLQRLRGMIDPVTGSQAVNAIQIRLKPHTNLEQARQRLEAVFPPQATPFRVRTWMDMQGPLLAAVHLETTILNVLLFLIIAVAGFGILATFYMIVVEKTKDIGILKSLGAPHTGVMSIFLGYGLSLGMVGSGVGLIGGLAFVWHINEVADVIEWVTGAPVFDPSVYYFQEIPTIVQPLTVTWIVIGAMIIAVLASVLPALRAARLHPVEALRYE